MDDQAQLPEWRNLSKNDLRLQHIEKFSNFCIKCVVVSASSAFSQLHTDIFTYTQTNIHTIVQRCPLLISNRMPRRKLLQYTVTFNYR